MSASERKRVLCPGGGIVIEERLKESQGHIMFGGADATGIKRKRLKCPKCKRRVMSSVTIDHDGNDVYHTLPPHKPKGWWKRKGGFR